MEKKNHGYNFVLKKTLQNEASVEGRQSELLPDDHRTGENKQTFEWPFSLLLMIYEAMHYFLN